MVEPASILVVDDEKNVRFLLAEELTLQGYEVSTAASGEEAVAMLEQSTYDLILLDLVMPGVDGLHVMREARTLAPDMVVIMLTAHATLDSVIEALRYGGHQYLVKPCTTEEILSSVETGLAKRRRSLRQGELIRQIGDIALQLTDEKAEAEESDAAPDEHPRYLHAADLVLDRARMSLTLSGKSIHLTPSEFRLVLCLMENVGRTVSFRQLAEAIHGPGSVDSSARDAISTHIWRLRHKLEAATEGRTRIASVRGEGYALEVQP